MPRRKTIQPEPLECFEVDGIEVEVRDIDTWPIGRGLHKQKAFETQADKMLESVFDDHFVGGSSLARQASLETAA